MPSAGSSIALSHKGSNRLRPTVNAAMTIIIPITQRPLVPISSSLELAAKVILEYSKVQVFP